MSFNHVRNYRNIEIEPNSYQIVEGIPRQRSLLDNCFTEVDMMIEERLEKMEFEMWETLPLRIRQALDESGESGRDDLFVFDDERLSFIEIPDPGRLTNRSSMVMNFRTECAQLLFCLENGLTLDQVRILNCYQTDIEFAIKLQFLRDNGVDIDSLDEKAGDQPQKTYNLKFEVGSK